jgi:hypothetical protein
MRHRSARRSLFIAAAGLLASACSSDGGGGGVGFQLVRISLLEGQVWKVNQEIVFTFNQEVDFSSISLNTISIQTTGGAPATGTFTLRGTDQVVFQPNCPRRDDLSDTGLAAGGVPYVIRVVGRSSGAANTVRAASGEVLQVTQTRNFTTPVVVAPFDAFLDTQQGPPVPVVRAQGSSTLNASYIEVGGDPDDRVYFELDASQAIVLSPPGFELPLNLYSDPASRFAVIVEFNQAINPSSGNVSSDFMRLEFLDNSAAWRPLGTNVTLVANCTETGARVRLEPIGALPEGSQIRAVILDGVTDLVGETTTTVADNFALAASRAIDFSSLTPASALSDEFHESFDFGGESSLSFEDTAVLSASPRAEWGDGALTAAFQFEGTGGPNGTFDWVVEQGESLVIDTEGGVILGADGITAQIITGGRLDARNVLIEGEVVVQGISPLRIDATGDVIIRGLLDVSGADARDVIVPNTGNVAEVGGRGGPGGGRGGNSNEVISNSTQRGGFGQGPLALVNAGGQGGETGFADPILLGKEARRPGGGAGGRFAPDQGLGLISTNGGNGSAQGRSAVVQTRAALGGVRSSGPFVDANASNNFFGTRALATAGQVTSLQQGELPSVWGGYGGGGGGNADPATSFPTPGWTPSSDEKGGAGGGGGGALVIRALGKIQFGASGLIRCNGGRGGVGENTQNQDHIGGNGGSGSGGHVILETASFVDFTDGGVATNIGDRIAAIGGAGVPGPTPTVPAGLSAGGAGGPGVIQLHVPDSITPPSNSSATSDIVLPNAALATGVDAVTSPPANVLVPAFSSRSIARSEWVSVGAAALNPGGNPASLVEFLFQGINTTAGADEGKVLVTGDQVQELTPLLDEDLEGNPNVAVLADRLTLTLTDASLAPFGGTTGGLSNALYLRTPALLEDFVLRLSVAAQSQDFRVASALYDEGAAPLGDEVLSLTVLDEAGDLQDFITANTGLGTIHYRLIPRFFRVRTGGVENEIPTNAFVRIRFQGTGDDGTGAPDAANPLVDWTADIAEFNALNPEELQFFRFEVEFDLAGGAAVTADTQAISLDFLRIPFLF